MKRWLLYLLALALVTALGGMPFSGTDVAQLQPVEVIRASWDGALVTVETDTGDLGTGEDLAHAFADLKETARGTIFLETAEHLLLTPTGLSLLPELLDFLRPACNVCLAVGEIELADVAAFLNAHEPGITLQDLRAGDPTLPKLISQQGRLHLVY